MSSYGNPASRTGRPSLGEHVRHYEVRVGRRDLQFLMYRLGRALALERRQRAQDGVDSLAVMLFDDPDSFERWWQDDTLRFDHPLLHHELRRDAKQLWELGDEHL